MRQAGVFAAACLVALDEMIDRLAEDHAHARLLAQGLSALDGIALDPATIETNIVYFDLTHPNVKADTLSTRLAANNILINPTGARQLRAVTNYHVSSRDVELVLDGIKDALSA